MQKTTPGSCECERTNATFHMPITTCFTIEGLDLNGPMQTWVSEWFKPTKSSYRTFEHELNLETPWLCDAMIVGRVTKAQAGWGVGEIIFTHGSDYNGTTDRRELGWLVSVSKNKCHAVFGNSDVFTASKKSGGYGTLNRANMQCAIVIRY